MTVEHKLKSASALSAFWDGMGHRRLRAGDGLIDLVGRRLSAHLMAQPDPAMAFLADPVLRGQGLLSRCLISAPASLSGTRLYRDMEPEDARAIEHYSAHLIGILRLPWPLASGKRNELAPRELTLSPEAVSVFREFSDRIELQCGAEGELNPIGDVAAKAAEQATRIAGVLTIINDPQAGEISGEVMVAGITLAEWYLREALRLHGAARTDPKLAQAQRLLRWLGRQTEFEVAFRDILRCAPREFRTKSGPRRPLISF